MDLALPWSPPGLETNKKLPSGDHLELPEAPWSRLELPEATSGYQKSLETIYLELPGLSEATSDYQKRWKQAVWSLAEKIH